MADKPMRKCPVFSAINLTNNFRQMSKRLEYRTEINNNLITTKSTYMQNLLTVKAFGLISELFCKRWEIVDDANAVDNIFGDNLASRKQKENLEGDFR